MHKKLVAALTIAIFVLSSVAIFTPASAHFTLGDYRSGARYHQNDFDPHFAGPTGYVWPGSGLASFTGSPAGFPAGYQTPWPGGKPLVGVGANQPQSVYQLEGDAYAPFGAILTSTEDHSNRGPLVFAFNFSDPCFFGLESPNKLCGTVEAPAHSSPESAFAGPQQVAPGFTNQLQFTGVTIYIPPEFDLAPVYDGNYGLVESTFAHTSSDWSLSQADMNDPIGPGWWVLTFEGNIHWLANHNYAEWYYVRINDVGAPTIAGKYFFKMFLWDAMSSTGAYIMNVPGSYAIDSCVNGGVTSPFTDPINDFNPQVFCNQGLTAWIPSSQPTFLTFPVENWPVLLVKGEVDPGFASGTVRYGTFNQSLYSKPINFPGRVDFVGTAIDPYLPDHPSTGRPVEARGYFNASAAGHYEVEGIAPGMYTVYAQAAGYPRQVCAENVVILPGQSFRLDCYLQPGPVVHGQIFSKHLFGEEPWPVNPRPIWVALFSANDYASEHMVASSPWNRTHAPYMSYDWGKGYSAPEPLPVAYPWDTVTAAVPPTYTPTAFSYYNQFFPSPVAGGALYRSHPAVTCGGNFDLCGKPDGVGPAQYWWVDRGGVFTNGGGANSFIFRFGVKGVYGAPTEFDGHIPQPYATWINGLTAGRYFVRSYLNGYVQTLQDGVTLDEASFEVSEQEWAGDVFLPFDLRVSSIINKTVHFHDQPGTLQECPITGCLGDPKHGDALGNRYLIAEVRDAATNQLMGMNFTWVRQFQNFTVISINGFGMMGPDPNSNFFDGGSPNGVACPTPATTPFTWASNGCGMKFSYMRYQGFWDYGLPSGSYVVRIYMRGYLQQTFDTVSLTLSGSPALISNHLYRGARFNITVYSIDWEHPRIQRPWEFPSARLRVYVYNDKGDSFQHVGTRYQPAQSPFLGATTGGTANVPGSDIATTSGIVIDGSSGGSFGGCNLAPREIADHCEIVEWDGFKIRRSTDTPPDLYATNSFFAGYLPFGSESFYYYDGFLTYPGVYYRRGASTNYAARNAIETGTYFFYGFTYGYLQHKTYSVYVMKGGVADIKLNLLQGVNITVNVPFKKEGIYSPTEANMTMRVRVFDDQGHLIGTAASKAPDSTTFDSRGPGEPCAAANDFSACGGSQEAPLGTSLGISRIDDDGLPLGRFDGFAWSYYVDPFAISPDNDNTGLGYKSVNPSTTADTFLWYGNYYGDGIRRWEAFDSDPTIAGFTTSDGYPDFASYNPNYGSYTAWIPAGTEQVRVFIAGVYDYLGDPLNTNFAGVLTGRTLDGKQPSQMYGLPGSSSTIPEGIPVSYSGKYYVEVDTWNEYPRPSFNGGDFTPPFAGYPDARNWYPPVQGLLEGDSFHTIPGASPDVFGYTGNSLAANGLGPYAQRMVWEVPNGHLGSEVSVVYELDLRGFISGNIYGFTWSDEIRPQSWVSVVASAAAGDLSFTSWSWDSYYDMYLDPGQYELAVIAWTPSGGEAYTVQKATVSVTAGQSSSGVTFQLERSNIPIPEFSGLAIVFASALAASLYLLRRKRR